MLIVEREVVNKSIASLVKQQYNVWFEEGEGIKIFRHENPADKVIIFYDKMQDNSNSVKKIEDSAIWLPTGSPLGYMIVYSKGTNILVSNMKFPGTGMKECLDSFWKYLIQCIKIIGDQSLKFMIYWRKSILDQQMMKIIQDSGLLSDHNTLSHTFSSMEISSNRPTPTQPSMFGSTQPSMFGSTQPSMFGSTTQLSMFK